uniref:Piwi domain-containing protein n=1 Tax=Arcella intermedia TaxID=1963864 RepID=A0A6B2LKT0_9EUKA
MVRTQEGLLNPAPGTSFEDGRYVPMRADIKDFFLVSTYNSTSTAKPVNYCLINGANAIELAKFQQLTFWMCHMYPNWANSIKVPFVTQAAHKLAYLLGGEANVTVHPHLQSSFFYL